jgi:hypothetical protein
MSSKPEILRVLGRHHGVRQLSDENLGLLHDYALITLVRCQYEMQRRGIPSSVIIQRSEAIASLSTDPGNPPACRCNVGDGS